MGTATEKIATTTMTTAASRMILVKSNPYQIFPLAQNYTHTQPRPRPKPKLRLHIVQDYTTALLFNRSWSLCTLFILCVCVRIWAHILVPFSTRQNIFHLCKMLLAFGGCWLLFLRLLWCPIQSFEHIFCSSPNFFFFFNFSSFSFFVFVLNQFVARHCKCVMLSHSFTLTLVHASVLGLWLTGWVCVPRALCSLCHCLLIELYMYITLDGDYTHTVAIRLATHTTNTNVRDWKWFSALRRRDKKAARLERTWDIES